MSEIRKTTTIEEIEAPPSEPLISLAEVLTAVGWVAYHGTRFAVKGAVAGTVLAYKGGKAIGEALKESRRRSISLSEVGGLVQSSSDAKDAVTKLAAYAALELPKKHTEAFTSRLKTLVASNDKTGIASIARQLIVARQTRLQAQLIPIVMESCRAIGFDPQIVDPASGIVVARGEGRQRVTIEVAKSKEGDVRLHTDSDGFAGGACAYVVLDPLEKELRSRGVRFELEERQAKDRRPVFDGPRIPNVVHAHVAR
jgi:hypothetical protein